LGGVVCLDQLLHFDMIVLKEMRVENFFFCASNSNGNGTFGQNVRETTTLFNAMNP
jgi:hypothetical protein